MISAFSKVEEDTITSEMATAICCLSLEIQYGQLLMNLHWAKLKTTYNKAGHRSFIGYKFQIHRHILKLMI
ncbi:hypothetical protein Hanom_Chr04g00282431 [Helianthus anomalus]